MAAARKRCLAVVFAISVFYWIFTSVIQSPRFTNDYEFFISVSTGCPKINFTFLNVNNVRTNICIATPAIYIDRGHL